MTTENSTARPDGEHPGPRRLERFAFGPDTASVSEDDRRHFRQCSRCRARIERLRSERDGFLEERPPEVFVENLEAHPSFPTRLEARPVAMRLAPVAALILLAVGIGWFSLDLSRHSAERSEENRIRFKGDADLRFDLFVSRGGVPATSHSPDEPLFEGDVLRFGIVTPTDGYLYIANIDAEGRTTGYYPQKPGGAGPIVAKKLQLPVETVVLDDFVGDELIAAVVSPDPLGEAAVLDALREAYDGADGEIDRIRALDVDGLVALKVIHKARSR